MAKKNIASVGLCLPQDDVDYVGLGSKQSLLEYDIVLFYPTMGEFFASDNYDGQRCYSASQSPMISSMISHWRNQISSAYASGRTVIIFLPPKKTFYIHTGEKQFSGTGRSRVTTNIVNSRDNYEIVPLDLSVLTVAEGTRTEFGSDYPPLREHWSALRDLFVYRAYFEQGATHSLLNVKSTKKVVAARVQNSEGGQILLMPDFAFDFTDEWVEAEPPEGSEAGTDDDEEADGEWTARSVQAADALIRFSLSVEAWAKDGSETPVEPEWATGSEYTLPLEEDAVFQIANLEKSIDQMRDQLVEQRSRLIAGRKAKALLYGKGASLESAVRDFFQTLGIDAKQEVGPDLEFDVVFDMDGQKVIGEVEGKDNKAISVEKISQLERCLQEDFAREETTSFAKGILFGNAFRSSAPENRGPIFTEKVVSAALRSGIVLVDTRRLFFVLRTVMRTGKSEAGQDFVRQMVCHSGGLFPPAE